MNLPHSNKSHKSSKNVPKTLDIQHNNYIAEFKRNEEKILQLKKKIEVTDKLIFHYSEKEMEKLNDNEITKFISLKDEKRDILNRIKKLEKSYDEDEYYMNTASLLFNYYDIIKNGNNNETNNIDLKSESILKYFVNKPEITSNNSLRIDDKAALSEKYMEYTDKNYIKHVENHKDQCQYCNSNNLNMMLNDGMIYCNDCFSVEYIIIDHDRPSYKDPPKFWAKKSICKDYQDMSLIKLSSFLFKKLLASLIQLIFY